MLPSRPVPPWPELAADTAIINRNVAQLDAQMQAMKGHRDPFTLDLVRQWHRDVHAGCANVPIASYVGNFRGTSGWPLQAYPVAMTDEHGRLQFHGTPPADVLGAVSTFEAEVQETLDLFDERITAPAEATTSRLNNLLDPLARHYADWIRIHPFADGNGRTGRLLVNWILVRYHQPLVFPGRPVPDRTGLARATAPALSTPPNHRALIRHLRSRLADARTAGQVPGTP